MSNYDLEGRAAFVTGGGTGIGRATAVMMAANGARVAVTGRTKSSLEETVDLIAAAGGAALPLVHDVRDPVGTDDVISRAVSEFGRIDTAFNSAGISGPMFKGIGDVSLVDFNEVMEINATGLWLSMRAQVAAMLASGRGGSIVNASSVAGLVGSRVNTAYSASKFAVVGMTKSVALEVAKENIRVNAVCPGWIETPMTDPVEQADPDLNAMVISRHPVGRAGQADEVAHLVCWLCSDAASFVTGAAYPVDGGLTAP